MSDWTTDILTLDAPPMPEAGPTLDDIEDEMTLMPHIEADLRLEADGIAHELRDARNARTATQAIGHIPGESESLHILISGRFALWDCVPALLTLAVPATITSLHISTLGFSRNNITELVELLDSGKIGTASLLCSHYFKGTSTEIYDFARAELAKRPQARFLSLRTHAKIISLQLSDGRTVTIESSANLRSCKNLEQMTLSGHAGLYAFHVGWIDQLFAQAMPAPPVGVTP